MSREIVLCIDMQRDFQRNFPGGYENACAAINLFNHAMADHEVPLWKVYYDQEGLLARDHTIISRQTPENIRNTQLDLFETSQNSGVADIINHSDAPVIFKNGSSAFRNKGLHGLLKENGVEKIHMLGFHAGDCVAATAIDASKLGFDVTIVQDLAFGNNENNDALVSGAYKDRLRRHLHLKFCDLLDVPFKDLPESVSKEQKELLEYVGLHFGDDKVLTYYMERTKAWTDHRNFNLLSYRFDCQKTYFDMRQQNHPDISALDKIDIVTTQKILETYTAPARAAVAVQNKTGVKLGTPTPV